ncbi:ubiquinol oxidase subunit II [Tianweitania populi]|uniref:Ubiquinol oxidase polypeptide II n=1 Tax=Tianweitania populi TaxID=1607949 RepID=A0A8J3GL14_9HYPH|nr:ubiquinol oxidase subunit II [Tianweitania populi]GHD15168.1 cytochrome ubiquinol oxidase subunit II [Tianweitania populi]
MPPFLRRLISLAILPALLLLGGCNFVVMSPSGDIAAQQRDLIIISVVLMLIIIIPVMVLTVVFAMRYRASNTDAPYDPDWDHSTQLELVIWAIPLLIIICLGAVTWMGTHLLDPYRPLDRIDAARPVAADTKPLEVNVVALDWKWLFIYPEYGIASVNELAAPVDRPIQFRITSSSVMNSFYVPALAGMIYAMPGMETKLHAVINNPGDYEGFSANYSGHGFSGMRFRFHGLDQAGFDGWIAKAKAEGGSLQRPDYLELERPSENVPVQYFATVDPLLFNAIRNFCVEPGKMCMSEMAMIDAKGGTGLAGLNNLLPLTYDKDARRGSIFGSEPTFVANICTIEEALAAGQADPSKPASIVDRTPLRGMSLPRPGTGSVNPSLSQTFGSLRPSNS